VDRDIPCQDAWAAGVPGENRFVLAVADGLGSARHSDLGARLAVDVAVETLSRHCTEEAGPGVRLCEIEKTERMLLDAAGSARSALVEEAGLAGYAIRDLACTLIIVLCDQGRISVAQIGDGGVVGLTARGPVLLSDPGESEYLNVVTPLTGDDWEADLRITADIPGVSACAAFTDGCQRAVLVKDSEGYEPFAPFFLPLFSYARDVMDPALAGDEVASLLSSQRFSENSEDDKTLCLAVF